MLHAVGGWAGALQAGHGVSHLAMSETHLAGGVDTCVRVTTCLQGRCFALCEALCGD